jgi:geranylgeranyl pyrophosphate synthase
MTQEEFATITPLVHVAERVFLATNDYYSWQKEKSEPVDRIWNATLFYMIAEGLSEQDAISKLKQFIIDGESRFLIERQKFCADNPDLPTHLKLMVNALEPAIGSYHFWCSVCPRFRTSVPISAEPFTIPSSLGARHDSKASIDDVILSCADLNVHGIVCLEDIDGRPNDKREGRGRSLLTDPISYVRSMPSKNVRGQLIDAVNLWIKVPLKVLDLIKETVDDLHDASLMLDDIQDQSSLRRGKVATHLVYGEAQTINSATYLFLRATKRIHCLGRQTMTTDLLQGLETLFIGQAMDLNWKLTMKCPSKEDYFDMVDKKTGAMFHLMFSMMSAAAGERSEMACFDKLSMLLGRWFQVRDDYMNLQAADYTRQKGFCEDFDEGKISYPVLCCHANDKFHGEVILGILRQTSASTKGTLSNEAKLQLLETLKRNGALHESFTLVKSLERQIEAEVGRLEVLYHTTNPLLRLQVLTLSNIPAPA